MIYIICLRVVSIGHVISLPIGHVICIFFSSTIGCVITIGHVIFCSFLLAVFFSIDHVISITGPIPMMSSGFTVVPFQISTSGAIDACLGGA